MSALRTPVDLGFGGLKNTIPRVNSIGRREIPDSIRTYQRILDRGGPTRLEKARDEWNMRPN